MGELPYKWHDLPTVEISFEEELLKYTNKPFKICPQGFQFRDGWIWTCFITPSAVHILCGFEINEPTL
jgi:hypothetical protein